MLGQETPLLLNLQYLLCTGISSSQHVKSCPDGSTGLLWWRYPYWALGHSSGIFFALFFHPFCFFCKESTPHPYLLNLPTYLVKRSSDSSFKFLKTKDIPYSLNLFCSISEFIYHLWAGRDSRLSRTKRFLTLKEWVAGVQIKKDTCHNHGLCSSPLTRTRAGHLTCLIYFNLHHSSLWVSGGSKFFKYPDFADKETEVQGGDLIFPQLPS